MTHLTNLVEFPALGLSFPLNRVAFSIGGINIYWYGVCIAVGMCLWSSAWTPTPWWTSSSSVS